MLGSHPEVYLEIEFDDNPGDKDYQVARRLKRACTSLIYSVIARWFKRIRSGLEGILSYTASGL